MEDRSILILEMLSTVRREREKGLIRSTILPSGKFRLQRNGKWGSTATVTPGELPADMEIFVRRDKVFVSILFLHR